MSSRVMMSLKNYQPTFEGARECTRLLFFTLFFKSKTYCEKNDGDV